MQKLSLLKKLFMLQFIILQLRDSLITDLLHLPLILYIQFGLHIFPRLLGLLSNPIRPDLVELPVLLWIVNLLLLHHLVIPN